MGIRGNWQMAVDFAKTAKSYAPALFGYRLQNTQVKS